MINITGNNEIPNHTQSSFSKLFFLWISDNNIPNIKNFIDDETNGEKVMSLLDEKNMTGNFFCNFSPSQGSLP